MKVQVKRVSKNFFCHQKNNKKAGRLFQINSPIFYCPLFFEEYFKPQARINKMVNEHTVGYNPIPSELTSRIHLLIFLWNPKGLSLQDISWIFLKPVYPTIIAEKLQIHGVHTFSYFYLLLRGLSLQNISWMFLQPVYPTIIAEKFQMYGLFITGKYICESKNRIFSVLLMPPNKNLPQVLIIIPQAKGNCQFSPDIIFWKQFFHTKRGDYGAEKMAKIKLLRVLVISLY